MRLRRKRSTVSVGFQAAAAPQLPAPTSEPLPARRFSPGALSRTISVEVNGEIAFEPDETFAVSLSSPVNALIADGQALGTILNDDSPANSPPAVRIINPPSGTAFTSPAEVSVTADAFDREGSVRRVEFFVGSTSIGSATAPPFTVTWMNEAAGAYSLTAHATDDQGAVAISEPAHVLVICRAAGMKSPSCATFRTRKLLSFRITFWRWGSARRSSSRRG